MEKTTQIKNLLDGITSQKPFKNTRSDAIKKLKCVMCNNPDLNFRDELSKKEYEISRICQKCQILIFGE